MLSSQRMASFCIRRIIDIIIVPVVRLRWERHSSHLLDVARLRRENAVFRRPAVAAEGGTPGTPSPSVRSPPSAKHTVAARRNAVVAVRSREDIGRNSSATVTVRSREDVAGKSSVAVAVRSREDVAGNSSVPPLRRTAESLIWPLKLENPNLKLFFGNATELREIYLDGVNISAKGSSDGKIGLGRALFLISGVGFAVTRFQHVKFAMRLL
nr:receptor-like protein 12 [Ipomoea batatas]